MIAASDLIKGANPIIEMLCDVPGAFMTGSAIIGGFDWRTSDIDVIVPIQYELSTLEIKAKGIYNFIKEPSNYNGGFKLIKQGASVPVNIIQLHPFDYCGWLFATNILAEQDTIKDKFARHRAFEIAVSLFKMSSTTGRHVTCDGAATYYDTHSVNLRTQYNELKSRYDINEIPF